MRYHFASRATPLSGGSVGLHEHEGAVWWLIIGLVLFLAVILLASRRSKPLGKTPDEVADQIEKFVEGSDGTYDWDDFTSFELADPYLESVRQRCIDTNVRYPPRDGRGWCNEEGTSVLRQLARDVREYARTGVRLQPPVQPN